MKNFTSKLIFYPNKSLVSKCKKIDFKTTSESQLKGLYQEMLEEIRNIQGFYKGNCVGLSANQLGYDLSIFVMSKYPKNEKLKMKHFDIFINPEIVSVSKESVCKWEGCISDKENMLLIKRPQFIKIKYNNTKGETKEVELEVAKSRIAQHEIDHINGVDLYSLEIKDKVKIKDLNENIEFLNEWIDIEYAKQNLI